MALVGHLSGSSQSASVIGVTGSVVFANQPAASFPTLTSVGTDTVFFVSGTIGGKAASLAKTVAVFGGDTVVSGTLTVGTGSISITSNEIRFLGGIAKIASSSAGLTFYDSGNPAGKTLTQLAAGSGGPTQSYWFSNVNNETYTTGSVVSSGSILVKGAAGSALVTLDVVSGDVTGSNFRSTGGIFSTSQTSFNLVNTTATTVNFAGAATSVNIGANGSGRTTINNDIAMATGNIIGNTAAGPVTLISSGNVVVKLDVDNNATGHKFEVQDYLGVSKFSVEENGNAEVANNLVITGTLAVNGSSVTTTNSTMTLFNAASTLNIGGASTVVTLGSGASSRVNIPGDLYVQGNVTALESTNTKVKDTLVILGSGSAGPSAASAIAFASGSTTAGQALVFGAGLGSDILAAVKADVLDGALAISVGTYTSYVPIRASKLELAGTTAYVTSSDGTTLTANGNALSLNANTSTATLVGATGVAINAQNNNIAFQNNAGTVLRVSGSGASGATLEFKGGSSTTTANLFADAGTSVATVNLGTAAGTALNFGVAGSSATFNGNVTGSNFSSTGGTFSTTQTTFNLVNTTATTVNFAGAANTLSMGKIGGVATISSTLTASSPTFFGDAVSIGGPSTADLTTTKTTANLFNTIATTVNFAGAGTNIAIGAAGSGATYLKNASLFVSGATTFGASVLPSADVTYDLGSPTFRWANMYTGDLHLKNDRGDWTIIEEPDFLTITNNRNGKRYKFVMEEIG